MQNFIPCRGQVLGPSVTRCDNFHVVLATVMNGMKILVRRLSKRCKFQDKPRSIWVSRGMQELLDDVEHYLETWKYVCEDDKVFSVEGVPMPDHIQGTVFEIPSAIFHDQDGMREFREVIRVMHRQCAGYRSPHFPGHLHELAEPFALRWFKNGFVNSTMRINFPNGFLQDEPVPLTREEINFELECFNDETLGRIIRTQIVKAVAPRFPGFVKYTMDEMFKMATDPSCRLVFGHMQLINLPEIGEGKTIRDDKTTSILRLTRKYPVCVSRGGRNLTVKDLRAQLAGKPVETYRFPRGTDHSEEMKNWRRDRVLLDHRVRNFF